MGIGNTGNSSRPGRGGCVRHRSSGPLVTLGLPCSREAPLRHLAGMGAAVCFHLAASRARMTLSQLSGWMLTPGPSDCSMGSPEPVRRGPLALWWGLHFSSQTWAGTAWSGLQARSGQGQESGPSCCPLGAVLLLGFREGWHGLPPRPGRGGGDPSLSPASRRSCGAGPQLGPGGGQRVLQEARGPGRTSQQSEVRS